MRTIISKHSSFGSNGGIIYASQSKLIILHSTVVPAGAQRRNVSISENGNVHFLHTRPFWLKSSTVTNPRFNTLTFWRRTDLPSGNVTFIFFLSFCCRSSSQMMERGAVGSSGFPHRSDRKQFVFLNQYNDFHFETD